jgi:hypothetical protein
MPAPERPAPQKVKPDTIGRMAAEIVRVPLNDQARKAVADLLQSLMGDMAALYAFDVGENEPAIVYDPAEAGS